MNRDTAQEPGYTQLFGRLSMKTPSKILLSALPIMIWLSCAFYFEVQWRGVENPGAGYGFGGALIYRFGLTAALILSAIVGSFCYYVSRPVFRNEA